MKRYWLTGWEYYVIGPLVVILVAVSFWLAITATVENYRLSQATDQIVRSVSLARELKVPNEAAPQRALTVFFDRVIQSNADDVEAVSGAFMGQEPEKAIVTPWGGHMRVFFYPSVRSMRLEMPVTASACRRILLFYAKDVAALGLRRIDIKEDDPARIWRLVYEEKKTGERRELQPEAIHGGCGDAAKNLLSLTFYL